MSRSLSCKACLLPEERCLRVRFPPTLCCCCLRELRRGMQDVTSLCSDACKSRWPLRLQRLKATGSTSPLLAPGVVNPVPPISPILNSPNGHYTPSSIYLQNSSLERSTSSSPVVGRLSVDSLNRPLPTPPPAYSSQVPSASSSPAPNPSLIRPTMPIRQSIPPSVPPRTHVPPPIPPRDSRRKLDSRVEKLVRMGFDLDIVQSAIVGLEHDGTQVTEEVLINHLIADAEPASPTTSLVRQITDLGFEEGSVRSTLGRLQSNRSSNLSAEDVVDELIKEQEPSLPRRPSTSDDGSKECSVCMSERSDSVIVPCGHVCLCLSCGEAVKATDDASKRTCPICRTQISSVVKLYFA
jgi:hypothetical protein